MNESKKKQFLPWIPTGHGMLQKVAEWRLEITNRVKKTGKQLFSSTDTLVQFKVGIDALGKVHKRSTHAISRKCLHCRLCFWRWDASKLWNHFVTELKDWDTDSFPSTVHRRQLPVGQLLAWITKCPLGSYLVQKYRLL